MSKKQAYHKTKKKNIGLTISQVNRAMIQRKATEQSMLMLIGLPLIVLRDKYGFNICMHIHDEIVAEHDISDLLLDEMNNLLSLPIPWAPGLLLKGDGFTNDYYKKE